MNYERVKRLFSSPWFCAAVVAAFILAQVAGALLVLRW
jgi:hypothetical protein